MASSSNKKKRANKDTKGKNISVDGNIFSGFSKIFYRNMLSEDVFGWKEEDLHAVADSICDLAIKRIPGEHKVRVFTPEQNRDGWQMPHTVIQMVNDDMPFIVDSIVAELADQNLIVDILFHPILNVTRGKDGKLEGINSDRERDAAYIAESWVFIQLDQVLTEEISIRMATTLNNVLDDVRVVNNDRKSIMSRLDKVIKAMPKLAAPVSQDDLCEAQDFLKYLRDGNFTFLGYRAFQFLEADGKVQSGIVPRSDRGVLKGNESLCFGQGADSPEVKALKHSKSPVMISKLIDQYSTVHHRAPIDAISVKIVDEKGNLTGMHLFVGFFTFDIYSCRTIEVPIVRQKVRETIQLANFHNGTRDRRVLEGILEKMPRDELFQMPSDALYALSMGILRLQSRQRVALFTHMDILQQYMSCLVYIPRDRFNTQFRQVAEKILEKALDGKATNYFTSFDDTPFASVLFTIKVSPNAVDCFDRAAIERQLGEIGREWDEQLKQVLIAVHGNKKGRELAYAYGNAFSVSYHESIDIENTVHDVRQLEILFHSDDMIRVDFYRLCDAPIGEARLKVYHKDSPVPLSNILPVLENMGLKCLSEMPYEACPQGRDKSIWIHDFILNGAEDVEIEAVKENFEEVFLQVWHGRAENDGINQLVLRAGLTCMEVSIIRTYSGFMRQAKFPFSRAYIEQVLNMYPQIAWELVCLFRDLHDPKLKTPVKQRGKASSDKITEMLQTVQKLDHDRILQNFKTLIEKTLRTSFFQTDENGEPKSYLAVKLDSKNIPGLPMPRPYVEVFVYSPRVEAIHLRGGEIARGGIRWSDRHDDFRTEVMGLIKSQMVKNTVIVPVGAKGGFIVKQPPKTGGREAYQQEGIECYKILVQALLDITDNNVKGKVVRPKDVVCHDGTDSYLVVAADKGTATFSNIANSLSIDAGFWLQDAFASGGSTGYDHKEVGITARGGWESVKRHFREMGKNIQEEPFTVIGVGDMAGDVFGNAMLLSTKMQVLGAFNHLHIFCDPAPDIETSFDERERLFKEKGGWDAYDKMKLSNGGMIYERSAKFLKLTPQIRKCFGIAEDQVTPDDLIKAILKADVGLLWFGGIGTFVKSSRESHEDSDDKSNDAVRVDSSEIMAKVIGEGANLGLTQLARVEYAHCGGRINTDFIDNSGGVDCSDNEVNIKILLTDVMAKGELTLSQRNKLMGQMTDDVAALVLRDNYQQSQALSLLLFKARKQLGLHADFIRDLEKSGITSRQLEGLPDDETLVRMMRDGKGLTRPELSVLLAYAKITMFTHLMKSDILDDPAMEGLLFDYFPKVLHKYNDEIRNHKLKRGIIATKIVNTLINRMGPTFIRSCILKTGASVEEVVRAFIIATEAFRARDVWKMIEGFDNKVPYLMQMTALSETSKVIKRAVIWFLRFGGGHLKVNEEIAVFKSGIDLLKEGMEQSIPESVSNTLRKVEMTFSENGMPEKIAGEVAAMILLSSATDIIAIARKKKGDIKLIASAYFQIGEKIKFGWLRQQASQIVPENDWQARVISGMMDDFYIQQAVLTSTILHVVKKSVKKDAEGQMKLVNEWFDGHQDMIGKITQLVSDLSLEQKICLEMLMLASQRIGQIIYQVK